MTHLMLALLLIVYTTLAFGIHGGQFVTGITHQIRNAICALPFGLVAYYIMPTTCDYPFAVLFFMCAYVGSGMGFDRWPLDWKGFVTFPPFGAILLPFAYSIDTKYKNVFQEYFSGFLYGVSLAAIALVVSLV